MFWQEKKEEIGQTKRRNVPTPNQEALNYLKYGKSKYPKTTGLTTR